MLLALLFTSGYGVANYLTMVFLPTYAAEFGGVAAEQALQANTAGQALALFVVPLAAWLTDRAIPRRILLIIAFAAEFVVAWGSFALVGHGNVGGVWAAQLGFAFLLALIMAAEPATMLAEQFRSEFRLSAYSVSFNLGIGLAGGTAPVVAVALIAATGNDVAPAWYLMLASAIAAGAAFLMVDRAENRCADALRDIGRSRLAHQALHKIVELCAQDLSAHSRESGNPALTNKCERSLGPRLRGDERLGAELLGPNVLSVAFRSRWITSSS